MLSDPSITLLWTVNTAAVIAVAAFLIAALRTRDVTSTEDGRALLLAAGAALAFCTAGFARRFGIDVADHLIASAFVVTATVYGHMLWRAMHPHCPRRHHNPGKDE